MAGKPSEQPPPGRSRPAGGGQGGEPARRGERAGPLQVARHVKGDGRALILYVREQPPPA